METVGWEKVLNASNATNNYKHFPPVDIFIYTVTKLDRG